MKFNLFPIQKKKKKKKPIRKIKQKFFLVKKKEIQEGKFNSKFFEWKTEII